MSVIILSNNRIKTFILQIPLCLMLLACLSELNLSSVSGNSGHFFTESLSRHTAEQKQV